MQKRILNSDCTSWQVFVSGVVHLCALHTHILYIYTHTVIFICIYYQTNTQTNAAFQNMINKSRRSYIYIYAYCNIYMSIYYIHVVKQPVSIVAIEF